MAKVVIVGGGVAGLSAGIYAQLSGHDSIICERQDNTGGNLTGWKRGGYLIDNCIHWLTGTNPTTDTYKMWCDLGALGEKIEVYHGESLYTCSRDSERVTLYLDIEKTRLSMMSVSRNDEKEIDDIIDAVKMMMKFMGLSDCGYEGVTGKLKFAASMPLFLKYYLLSTGELAKRFNSQLLRDFICGVLGEDFGAIALISVFAIYCGKNGGIPHGGSVAMAERMTERFLSLGGQIFRKSEVIGIERNGKLVTGVKLSDGRRIDADYLILSCDPYVSFKKILSMPIPSPLKEQYNDRKMKRFSSIHCAFACDLENLPFCADHIFEVPKEDQRIMRSKYIVLREFSHEPNFAPQGKNIIQSLTFCGERDCRRTIVLSHKRSVYAAKKEEYAQCALKLIESKFPELKGHLKAIDVWTPATYKRYTDCEMGSYMGFILPPRKMPIRMSGKVRNFKNVFLATQWQQSPGGLPTAASCGRETVKAINRQEFKVGQRLKREKGVYAR